MLESLGHMVCATVSSGERAIEKALETRPQLALIDLDLEGAIDGIEVAGRIRSFDTAVLYLTDGAEGDRLQRAGATVPFGYVLKPVEERQLRLAIETALSLYRGKTILAERERHLSTILNHVEAAVIAIDASGSITFVNSFAESLTAWRYAELSGVRLTEFFHVVPEEHLVSEETVIPEQDIVLNILHWGARISGSAATVRSKRGQKTTVNYHAAPLRDAQGNLTGAILVFQPGAKAQQIEQELKRTVIKLQSRLRLMEIAFESVGVGVAVADKQGHILLANQMIRQIVGANADGKPLAEWSDVYGAFQPDEKTPVSPHELPIVRAIHGEASDAELFVRNSAKPEGIHIGVSARPLLDDIDGVSAGVIVIRDLTRRRETEKRLGETVDELQQQTQLMQAIFKSMSDGVVVADETGKLSFFNPAAERIVGMGLMDVDPDQWTAEYGIFYNDKITPVPTDELPLVHAMRGKATDEVEVFIRNASKPEGVHISVGGRPIVSGGTPRGGVIVFRDVTERVRAEEALAQAFAQGRLEVMDTILHNIGNAISSVAVGVGTLQEQLAQNRPLQRFLTLAEAVKAHQEDWDDYIRHDPQGRQVRPFLLAFADVLVKQYQQLLRTVQRVNSQTNHIVDIVRTQRDFENSTTHKDINLRQAVHNALRIVQESFIHRGIRTHLNFGNAPDEVRIRESQFHQMLVNLFKNAMEAIDELRQSGDLRGLPRMEIRAYVRREFLVLDVIDNGVGIARKNLKMIFVAGYSTKRGGSGLGLHSAANFVTSSGGKIQPLSDGIGQGTTMRVMLRLATLTPKRDGGGEMIP